MIPHLASTKEQGALKLISFQFFQLCGSCEGSAQILNVSTSETKRRLAAQRRLKKETYRITIILYILYIRLYTNIITVHIYIYHLLDFSFRPTAPREVCGLKKDGTKRFWLLSKADDILIDGWRREGARQEAAREGL